MPCFKGIAVSIHANGPIPEHGIVKQSRASRVTSYIPVPEPTLNPETSAQEPAKFAISITLLTKGLQIPYSTPPPTADDPYPKPRIVGAPGQNGSVSPYIPLTSSENETIAAYIYFDGRAKEEVATLLRPGEETWVNSRWVQVPESEGGGLAEREFLFREVALERWLNGLDLKGHDAADKLERRKHKYERRQRRQEKAAAAAENGGVRSTSPMDSDSENSSAESDDEIPEAAGQIKVAMFRVLASGEIKKGEYSPQFDAHDDDDDDGAGGNQNGSGVGADVEHTTSFAKPKTLDPKTISTQTVTGIDGPDKPYATFTFFYRGKRQLEKMGVLPSSKTQATPSSAVKRRSAQIELPKLGPLKTGGTVGFSAFRDNDADTARRRKSRKKSIAGSPSTGVAAAMAAADSDSDADEDSIATKMEDTDEKDVIQTGATLNPDEAKFSRELADGVERIHLKRARSADPDSAAANPVKTENQQPASQSNTPDNKSLLESLSPVPSTSATFGGSAFNNKNIPDDAIVGSPLKKQRALSGPDAEKLSQAAGLGSILAQVQAGQTPPASSGLQPSAMKQEDEEEEL
ncbi:hypothetical protein MGG_02478 [Pyricularia oryzae 70-15]|uniref:DUF7918 domain-containing protein n=3 Tax=Pyricularia oryzae TaxID=318829 RepID=G4MRZ2_PYRO7|nr:uncharacterized protein MGG_02478 [Pyricularia oryzae 70-15]EHA56661.1 hypothetical protein MGG_02478 [Pyricularia oryzae 70-15]ELQ35176.1 hypothetical protein OOU_Y34scaffold00725g34 [Pyricularia oryzae Y34]KAI7930140.1 hypothetical protein M9X92_000915 [Pyricularia oryzae]KAI7930244.1 hypothetical protein M0657_001713 [Pyricularia oryzae]